VHLFLQVLEDGNQRRRLTLVPSEDLFHHGIDFKFGYGTHFASTLRERSIWSKLASRFSATTSSMALN